MWERPEAGPACLVFSRPVAYHLPLRFPMAATFQMGTYCSWTTLPNREAHAKQAWSLGTPWYDGLLVSLTNSCLPAWTISRSHTHMQALGTQTRGQACPALAD